MDWQSIIAALMFVTAFAFVLWRGKQSLFSSSQAGCGGGCKSCGPGQPVKKQLLSIDGTPERLP